MCQQGGRHLLNFKRVASDPVNLMKLSFYQKLDFCFITLRNTEFFFDVSLNSTVNKTIQFVFASGLMLTGKSFVWFKSLKFHVGHFESSRSFMEIKTAKVTKGRSFLAHYTANRVGRLTKSIQQS